MLINLAIGPTPQAAAKKEQGGTAVATAVRLAAPVDFAAALLLLLAVHCILPG